MGHHLTHALHNINIAPFFGELWRKSGLAWDHRRWDSGTSAWSGRSTDRHSRRTADRDAVLTEPPREYRGRQILGL